MFRIRKVIYATDFSSYSTQAYFHAVGIAENYKAGLDVITVIGPDDDREESTARLMSVRPSNAKIAVKHVLLEGDPASEIVAYAQEARADVIVMGTHGRGGVERLILGSVAERVLRDSHCSVMVVKLPGGSAARQPHQVLATATA